MRDLTKWPRLLVVGQPITEDQAAEIILRTTQPWMLHTNDREWRRAVFLLLDFETDDIGYPTHEAARRFAERVEALPLNYLDNSGRIASSWIGGPKGWVDWNGAVGTTNYNIGKYPSVTDVQHELERIAETWPFLDFKAQLVSDEGRGEPVVDYLVSNGRVTMHESTHGRFIASPGDLGVSVIMDIVMPGVSLRERGCSIEQLQHALEVCDRRKS